jgi:hypothetical protein
MLLDETIKFSDKEIMEKGSRALIKELGYAGFLRFIRQFESSSGEDYLKVQDDTYKGATLDEVFDVASKNWYTNKTKTDKNI